MQPESNNNIITPTTTATIVVEPQAIAQPLVQPVTENYAQPVVQSNNQTYAQPAVFPPSESNNNLTQTPPNLTNAFDGKFFRWIFTIGFSSIFLINSLNAAIKPNDFIKLLAANPISHTIGHYSLMTTIIVINDLIIGILILTGWKKKYVWAWSGGWLIIVAVIKALYIF